MINFFAFGGMTFVFGGDAMNGKIENGHYFLFHHGGLTEVSKGVFTYSLWHARSVFVSSPVVWIAGGWIAYLRKWRRAG